MTRDEILAAPLEALTPHLSRLAIKESDAESCQGDLLPVMLERLARSGDHNQRPFRRFMLAECVHGRGWEAVMARFNPAEGDWEATEDRVIAETPTLAVARLSLLVLSPVAPQPAEGR